MSSRLAALTAAALVVGGLSSTSARADWFINLTQSVINGSVSPAGDAWVQFTNGTQTIGSTTYNTVKATFHNDLTNPNAALAMITLNILHSNWSSVLLGMTANTGTQTGDFAYSENSETLSNGNGQGGIGGWDLQFTYPPLTGGSGNDKFFNGDDSSWTFYSTDTTFSGDWFKDTTNYQGTDYYGGVFVQTDGGSFHSGGTTFYNGGSTPPWRGPEPVPVPASIIGLLTMGAGLFAFRRMVSIA